MLCLETKIPMKNQFKHHFGIYSFLSVITRVMTLGNTVKTNCNITGPPVILGIWGEWLFIFRELRSTSNYFQGFGEQAHSSGDTWSPAKISP